jgi:mRNA interferase YafQ
MEVKFEKAFKTDYKRIKREHPAAAEEFVHVLKALLEDGEIPSEYNPHLLDNPKANYTGHMEFHLAEGAFDVLVIYMPHKTNPVVRFVRMGSHDELFHDSLH